MIRSHHVHFHSPAHMPCSSLGSSSVSFPSHQPLFFSACWYISSSLSLLGLLLGLFILQGLQSSSLGTVQESFSLLAGREGQQAGKVHSLCHGGKVEIGNSSVLIAVLHIFVFCFRQTSLYHLP